MERVYLTKEGYEKLVGDLDSLKNVKRREIAAALNHARSLGDLSENAEYDAAKEAFAHNEAKIQDLEDKLSRAEIIDDVKVDGDKAFLGAKLKLLDLEMNEEIDYILVGQEEADPVKGFISITSPVGKALLGHKVGDVVDVVVPAGTVQYKILQISR